MRKLLWGLMAGTALIVVLIASRYFTLDPGVYFPEQRAVYETRVWTITLHVLGGTLALLLGPVQFLGSVRRRAPRVHRWIGRAYLFGVVLGGVCGMALAPVAYGGLAARVGFAGLAVAWLATGVMAYLRIRQRRVREHRAWMIRSFALTFAAVTLRLELPLLVAAGLAFPAGYAIVAWVSWLGNLAVAEWILSRNRGASVRTARTQTA